MTGILADLFTFLQVAIGLFLIFIIMLQRGKGGGLVGALGGMGGGSAFGPKADIHALKFTIYLAIAWVIVACCGIFLDRNYSKFGAGSKETPSQKEEESEEPRKDGDGTGSSDALRTDPKIKTDEKDPKKDKTEDPVEPKKTPAAKPKDADKTPAKSEKSEGDKKTEDEKK